MGEDAAGHDAVQMDVLLQLLPPGMQHAGDAEFSVPPLIGEWLQGFGGRLEQQDVYQFWIVSGEKV